MLRVRLLLKETNSVGTYYIVFYIVFTIHVNSQ
jgi:hypothetical protein